MQPLFTENTTQDYIFFSLLLIEERRQRLQEKKQYSGTTRNRKAQSTVSRSYKGRVKHKRRENIDIKFFKNFYFYYEKK